MIIKKWKSKIKWLIIWLYCYRFLSFRITNRLVKRLKND